MYERYWIQQQNISENKIQLIFYSLERNDELKKEYNRIMKGILTFLDSYTPIFCTKFMAGRHFIWYVELDLSIIIISKIGI